VDGFEDTKTQHCPLGIRNKSKNVKSGSCDIFNNMIISRIMFGIIQNAVFEETAPVLTPSVGGQTLLNTHRRNS
jgi:hypothetical protein